MIDLLHLKTFVVVATTKSFNRAAAELGYSQSNVTYHIKLLEKELGVKLFDRFRFSKTISLTEVGRQAYRYANRLLMLAEETTSAIKQKRKLDPLVKKT